MNIKKNNYKLLVFILLTLNVLLLFICLFFFNNCKYLINEPFLSKITILGKEIELQPNIYVYDISMKKGEIMVINESTCSLPYYYLKNDIKEEVRDSYNAVDGFRYFVAGEMYAEFGLYFTKTNKNDESKDIAKYHFIIHFDEPLVIAEGC